jgi:serine/threonine-protein kinase
VKPANVLLDRAGRAYLADFGLARARDSEQMTQAGQVVGTPVYMPPEQLRGEELDARSDQYALGVLAYYLLTGQPPFEADSMVVVFSKTLFEEPALPSRIRPQMHRGVDYILLKAMEKDRGNRFGTCKEFVDALDRIFQSSTLSGSRPGLLGGGTKA